MFAEDRTTLIARALKYKTVGVNLKKPFSSTTTAAAAGEGNVRKKK